MTEEFDQLEDWLRRSRAAPRTEFVRTLEASLFETSRPPSAARQARPFVAATGFAALLAGLVAALGVAGLLPPGLGEERAATARQRCATVLVVRSVVRPEIVVGADGQLRVERRRQTVRRPVRHCR